MTTATLLCFMVLSSEAPTAAAPAPDAAAAPDAGVVAPATSDGEPEASPAAIMFGKKCSSCHTLGDGDRTGPDLVGVTKRRETAWIKKFVRTPGAVIDSGDATARELLDKFKGVRMPDQDLKDDELDAIAIALTALACLKK